MRYMEDLKYMLCDELAEIVEAGELNAGSLDTIDKLTHSIKSIEAILAMSGHSREGNSGDGSSSDSYSQRRDSRGRFSRDYRDSMSRTYGRSYGNSYDNSYRGYSRDEGKEQMIGQLEDMAAETKDGKVKEAIKKALKEIEG